MSVQLKRGDMIFKLGISGVSVAEIIGLLYLGLFGTIQEYDVVHEETIGLVMIVIATFAAVAMFLVIIFFTIKWKGHDSQ
jgi:hypothetical protein